MRVSNEISQRPEEAENRIRLGDHEADTAAGTTGKACLVTLVECKSITPDRGKEFSRHESPILFSSSLSSLAARNKREHQWMNQRIYSIGRKYNNGH